MLQDQLEEIINLRLLLEIFKGQAAWYKINQGFNPVYFEATTAQVTWHTEARALVGALKLVNKSGEVSCVPESPTTVAGVAMVTAPLRLIL